MHLRIARHTEQLVGTFTGHDGYSGSTEKRRVVAELYLYLAAALTVLRRLINEARTRYAGQPDPPPEDSSDHQLPVVLPQVQTSPAQISEVGGTSWACEVRVRRAP